MPSDSVANLLCDLGRIATPLFLRSKMRAERNDLLNHFYLFIFYNYCLFLIFIPHIQYVKMLSLFQLWNTTSFTILPHFSCAGSQCTVSHLHCWITIQLFSWPPCLLSFLLPCPSCPSPGRISILLCRSRARACFMAPYCLLYLFLIPLLALKCCPYPDSTIFINFSPMITDLSGTYTLASAVLCVCKVHSPLSCWSLCQ